ncbi:hypothetical protein HAQ03_13860 [Acidithiobacillus caldus]|uniref:toprim domain-containing protein n=2 Tax=Acidithiobacillus caldus TaxID=33059 RepID=UPI001C0792CB|nr:toprim domain-containing protein [Acidithiobacillus caldus]MBU2764477.1 hypothetical protein [Acidithiobacillus caldus]
MDSSPLVAFFDTLQAAGVAPANPSALVADGLLHRHRIEGDKPGSLNGWHVLHLDNPPSGAGGSWKTGARVNWCAKRLQSLTPAERVELARRIEQDRARAQAETERRHREAAKRGKWAWEHAKPASPSHEYLQRKRLAPGIARQRGASLVLPVVDFTGHLRGVQYIQPDGQKRFIGGMAKAGAYIPAATRPDGTRPLWIAEGWGTACALQAMRPEACCIAGLDAGNLLSVALEARKRWPNVSLVIAGDFDAVGQSKAHDAAIAARARILPPPAEIPEGATDWLDVRNAKRQGVAHA